MAEGRHGPAAEQLLRLLEAEPERADARALLRQCLDVLRAGRAREAGERRTYAGRVAMLVLAMALPWAAAMISAWLMLGFDHFLIPCLIGAGCIIVPTAMMLPLPEDRPIKQQLDTLAVIFALGWLAVSMIFIARGTGREQVMLAFTFLLAGSIVAPLLVMVTRRETAPGRQR